MAHHHARTNFPLDPLALGFSTFDFVFLCKDTHCLPLCPPYCGPYHILRKFNKTFNISVHSHAISVSVDALKPAFLPDDFITHVNNDSVDCVTHSGHVSWLPAHLWKRGWKSGCMDAFPLLFTCHLTCLRCMISIPTHPNACYFCMPRDLPCPLPTCIYIRPLTEQTSVPFLASFEFSSLQFHYSPRQ